LDWFSTHPLPGHPFNFSAGARWYSEALLPTAFQPRHQGDALGESRTHADGVIGHIEVGATNKAGVALLDNATQLIVLEAKLLSRLSAGVKGALTFDQAARNVACIAEMLFRARRLPSEMTDLGFYVVAPEAQINHAGIAKPLSRESIVAAVAQRVAAYGGAKDQWHQEWFHSLMLTIKIDFISWEAVIATIRSTDPDAAKQLDEFYKLSIKFNRKWASPSK
jgi:hypothetical protein